MLGILNTCLFLLVKPYFIYTSNSRYYHKETALRHQDKFINCSVELHNVPLSIQWEYKNDLLPLNCNLYGRRNNTKLIKYSQNCTGLTIHNVTEDDQGNYTCLVGNIDPLNAIISLNVVCKICIICIALHNKHTYMHIMLHLLSTFHHYYHVYMCIFSVKGPPALLFQQNQTVMVNVSEQVVLNCTVSSSPDPVYNWSTPDTCSSCPHINNDSVMVFTANITDSGEYICEAKNEYGIGQMTFTVRICSKCIISMIKVINHTFLFLL